MSPSTPRTSPGRWPDYRTVWRWHFYAGLFCVPFVMFLSITGSIYLFQPQIQGWLDRAYDSAGAVQAAPPSQVVAAAMAANPGWALHAYQLPASDRAAAQVIVGRNGEERRVYVDRGDLRVLRTVPEEQRFMRVIFHLHGELLQGDRGSMVVELAASWTVVMIITGLYLWWPRHALSLRGAATPRLDAGRRLFWRDLHAVTGAWVSVLALLILASGLPWAKNWGGYLKEVRQLASGTAIHQDWTTGRSSEIAANRAHDMAGMAMAGGGMGGEGPAGALQVLDRVAPTVAGLRLPGPVLIRPPAPGARLWTGASEAADRPLRVEVKLDPTSGAVVKRTGFGQHELVDRVVAVGVAAHEGQLFGWANQLLGLTAAAGLLTVSVSAVVLWWRRRNAGVLGAPVPAAEPRFSWALAVIVVALGLLLPEFGVSLLVVLAVERLVLRRVPPVGRWLGLRAA